MATKDSVLFVCTGNLCRSPTAAWFLSQRLEENGVHATVRSAGTLQVEGRPPAELLEVGQPYGLDLSGHQPRRVDIKDVRNTDLVLAMTREHVRAALLLDRGAFARTFTLREFVRRSEAVGARKPSQRLSEWVQEVNGDRRPLQLVGESAEDDVADPIGGPVEGYREMVQTLQGLCDSLYQLVWGAASHTT